MGDGKLYVATTLQMHAGCFLLQIAAHPSSLLLVDHLPIYLSLSIYKYCNHIQCQEGAGVLDALNGTFFFIFSIYICVDLCRWNLYVVR